MKLEASCNVQWPCDVGCIQDFEAPCPAGWSIDDEGVCKAASHYDGICIREADLRRLQPQHKRLWGEMCTVQWYVAAIAVSL